MRARFKCAIARPGAIEIAVDVSAKALPRSPESARAIARSTCDEADCGVSLVTRSRRETALAYSPSRPLTLPSSVRIAGSEGASSAARSTTNSASASFPASSSFRPCTRRSLEVGAPCGTAAKIVPELKAQHTNSSATTRERLFLSTRRVARRTMGAPSPWNARLPSSRLGKTICRAYRPSEVRPQTLGPGLSERVPCGISPGTFNAQSLTTQVIYAVILAPGKFIPIAPSLDLPGG